LKWLGEHPKTKLVFISSCAVYGRGQITREDSDLAPISINGTCKLLNEQMIERFCVEKGVPYRIFRLFNTYGGNDRFSIIANLKKSVREAKPFTLLNQGISARDFIHVEDAAKLILRSLANDDGPNVMNLGSGEAIRIREIVSIFRLAHPELQLTAGTRPETEFSRADVTRLRSLFPDYTFRNVLDFIRKEL
jgi:nucleoside-diphosphate-sugar epimerase